MRKDANLNKFLINPVRTRLVTARLSMDEVNKWAGQWRFFFILGFGRSGTAFMADLLNQAPGAYVFHEPVLEDFYAHLRAHYSCQDAERYMQGFRRKEIYWRMRRKLPGVYGEVNGNLRCHAAAIQNVFPDATVLHLVRDGRDVIRSAMPRRIMTIRNPLSLMIHPAEKGVWYERWSHMDRFARICWYWQEENARLRKTTHKTIQFEKILSSYEYFEAEVLQPCQISIDPQAWEAAVGAPKNTTARHQMPKWEGWTPEQQRLFKEICGNEMTRCGYEI